MESFFSRYKNGLVLLGVLIVQLFGLAMQVRRPLPNSPDGKPVRLLRYWVVSVVAQPEKATHGAGLGVRGVWSNYLDLRHVRQQDIDLKAELDRLRLEEAGLAEDARQGQRLQRLLDFKEHYIYKTEVAQVIGTAGTDRSRVLLIDKGSDDGLANDMPVITPDGIVGKVREVFPHTAQVLAISDQSSGAGVMLQTTRIRGVLRGNAFGQPQIINIMPDDRIKPGEPVVTSGGDQIYPRGLPVGVVDSVADDPDRQPYIDVIVKPGANLAQLEEVLIVTSMGDSVPATEASDLARSEAEAAEMKRSAADVLSEKLPSVRDPNAPPADPNAPPAPAAKPGVQDTVAAKPLRPPPPLHPDRFTPGAVPSAASSTPGVAIVPPPHNAAARIPASDLPGSSGTGSSGTGSSEPDLNGTGALPNSAAAVKRRPSQPVGDAAAPAPSAVNNLARPSTVVKPTAGTASPAMVKPGSANPALTAKAASTTPKPSTAKRSTPLIAAPYHLNPTAKPAAAPSRPPPPTYVEPYFVKPPRDEARPSPAAPTPNKPTQAKSTQAKPGQPKSSPAKPARPYQEKPAQAPPANPAPSNPAPQGGQ